MSANTSEVKELLPALSGPRECEQADGPTFAELRLGVAGVEAMAAGSEGARRQTARRR